MNGPKDAANLGLDILTKSRLTKITKVTITNRPESEAMTPAALTA